MVAKRVSIFGLGRVGLVTAACLAKKGYSVLGVDIDSRRLKQIQNAQAPFFEPGLASYLRDVVADGTLKVTQHPALGDEQDVVFITVGTPSNRNGRINLTYIRKAAHAIGRSLHHSRHTVVVIKSTVTPGTARTVVKPILEKESGKKAGKDFNLCSNPEFLVEGNAIHGTEFPDRIIIGSEHAESNQKLEEFYRGLLGANMPPAIRTTHENAELIKYANNAFLTMKVSFANCIANIAERIPGADVKAVVAGIGLDQRIGPRFLNAGPGWGGSCFPKDLKALLTLSENLGYNPELIKATIRTNEKQWRKATDLVRKALGSLKGKRVAVLGLAFKPNTDDMRDAPSIPIVNNLVQQGAIVTVYDPAAMQNAQTIFRKNVKYARDPTECIEGADCSIIVTEWDEFKKISPRTFVERMRKPILIDGRRIYDAEDFSKAGIQFFAVGLSPRT